jgi:hypothetical protein
MCYEVELLVCERFKLSTQSIDLRGCARLTEMDFPNEAGTTQRLSATGKIRTMDDAFLDKITGLHHAEPGCAMTLPKGIV